MEIWKDTIEVRGITNLKFVGYVSDQESKALMLKCKAFIHPSFYEGFGIPPLEALTCNAKILVSNSTCLPEIYEDSAVYFNPNDYDVNLDELIKTNVSDREKILKKCSWEKSSETLLSILTELAIKG